MALTVTYTFSPNTTAAAAEVNQNFTDLTTHGMDKRGDTMTGSLLFSADNTYDIGASGATRPRDFFLGRNATVTGTFAVTSTSTFTGAATFNGGAQLADQVLQRPEIKDYAETRTAPTIASGVLTLNLENGNIFDVSLNANITTLTISNPPATGKFGSFLLMLTGDGTARTISWPAAVKWAGATAPTPTSTNGQVDIYSFFTDDAGTTWYATIVGQNY